VYNFFKLTQKLFKVIMIVEIILFFIVFSFGLQIRATYFLLQHQIEFVNFFAVMVLNLKGGIFGSNLNCKLKKVC